MATLTVISATVIACPTCPRCGTRMEHVRILPDRPAPDQRIYESPRCEYEVTEIVNFKKTG
jgi:hypothetical protein